MKAVTCFRMTVLLVVLFAVEQNSMAQGYLYQSKERSMAFGVGWGYMFSDAASKAGGANIFQDLFNNDAGFFVSGEYRTYARSGLAYVFNGTLSQFQGARDFVQHVRDYKYRSTLGEASVLINFELLSFFSGRRIPLDIYTITGLGGVAAFISSQKFAPESGRPDGTDHLRSFDVGANLIVGAGLRFPIAKRVDIRLEGKYHSGTSDYLDGYLPKASKYPDLMVEGTLKLSFRLKDVMCDCMQ